METTVFLHEASDAEGSYAISLPGDAEDVWRAEKGFGQKFQKVWTVDLQSAAPPSMQAIDWDRVLTRVVEAYTMNDPVITNYVWPSLAPDSRTSST